MIGPDEDEWRAAVEHELGELLNPHFAEPEPTDI